MVCVLIFPYTSKNPSKSGTPQLRQLSIEFDESDVCFAPGDVICGFVVVGVSQQQAGTISVYHDSEGEEEPDSDAERSQCFEIVELRMKAHGGARLKGKNRNQAGREQAYFDMEMELIESMKKNSGNEKGGHGHLLTKIGDRLIKPGGEKLVKFEFCLPEKGLCTSLESKSASVLYVLRVSLTYRNLNNEIRRVNAVRGFSVVECVDLTRFHNHYFQPASHQLVKKFGLFSCTGGQIRLHFSVNRSAFVCGENIIIEVLSNLHPTAKSLKVKQLNLVLISGRLDNRTDRRVDKVAAVLQQIVVVHGSLKGVNLNLLDVTDIHEDNLALFLDQMTALKIERNFAIPPLPPSTYGLDGSESTMDFIHIGTGSVENHLGSHVAVDMARRYRRHSSNPNTQNQRNRFLKVLYQLSVRVKTGGVEVMEINVPILIGNLPQRKMPASAEKALTAPSPPQNAFTRAALETAASLEKNSGVQRLFALSMDEESEPMALFMHNRKEGSAKLGQPGETYICNRSQLNFTNKYPFFVNLPTSSKQSRKVSMLANTIRAENSFVNALRQEQQQSIKNQQWEKEGGKNENEEENGEKGEIDGQTGERIGTSSTAHSEPIRRQFKPRQQQMGTIQRRSTLPPVEILAEHLGRTSIGGSSCGSGGGTEKYL